MHDYDPLQKKYAQLLSGTLMLQDGVAVIEIEEARAIAQELSLSGHNDEAIKARHVPLIVEGQYRMEIQPGVEDPVVSLSVKRGGVQPARPDDDAAMRLERALTLEYVGRNG